jgi:hypothetical protein
MIWISFAYRSGKKVGILFDKIISTCLLRKGGLSAPCSKTNKIISSQIEKPPFLGIVPLLQISKFLMCAILQIANPLILLINPQIANPQIYTKYCTNSVSKR